MPKAKRLLEENPKVHKMMKDWLGGITDQSYLEVILTYTPRIFYNFFDEKRVFINVKAFDAAGDILYNYSIHGKTPDLADYTTREEAEEAAFTEAIKILENAQN